MSGAPLNTAFDFDVEPSTDVLEMVLQSHSTTPDHIAVVSGTERVSYRHLMLMASHNAASLGEAGLQAGECLLCGVDTRCRVTGGLVKRDDARYRAHTDRPVLAGRRQNSDSCIPDEQPPQHCQHQ